MLPPVDLSVTAIIQNTNLKSKATSMNSPWDYNTAFSRNIGWVTEQEQQALKAKRVAIAGMGGVGGSHLLTLARLGIGAFNIADFDNFEVCNFNRQRGATVSHLGKAKVDALADMALDINPELDIKRYPEGVTDANLQNFLQGLTCMSMAWISSPSKRAGPSSLPVTNSAFPQSPPRRWAWALRC